MDGSRDQNPSLIALSAHPWCEKIYSLCKCQSSSSYLWKTGVFSYQGRFTLQTGVGSTWTRSVRWHWPWPGWNSPNRGRHRRGKPWHGNNRLFQSLTRCRCEWFHLNRPQRIISLMLNDIVRFSSMSHVAPIGHFNFAQTGHYYFALHTNAPPWQN